MNFYQAFNKVSKVTFSKTLLKSIVVWQVMNAVEVWSVSPYPTAMWILGSLALSIIFSILLKKPSDLALGIGIAAYAYLINRFPGLPPLFYLIWSFYRLDKQKAEKDEPTETSGCLAECELAGFWRRAAAFSIDVVVFLLFFVPVSVAVGGLAPSVQPVNPHHKLIMVLTSCILSLGLAVMESSLGATLGKKAMGLCVVDLNGDKLSFGAALVRNFLKFNIWTIPGILFPEALFLNIFSLVGQIIFFGLAIITSKHQTGYDYVARSIVLRHTPANRNIPVIRQNNGIALKGYDTISYILMIIFAMQALIASKNAYLALGSISFSGRGVTVTVSHATRAMYDQLYFGAIISGIGVLVLSIVWIYKSYRFIHALNPKGTVRYTPGSAVAVCLIPLVNLFMVPLVVRELFRKSQPLEPSEQMNNAGLLTGIWWASALLPYFLLYGADWLLSIINTPQFIAVKTMVATMKVKFSLSIAATALTFIDLGLSIFIIYRIRSMIACKKNEAENELKNSEAENERQVNALDLRYESFGENPRSASDVGRKFLIGYIILLVVAIGSLTFLMQRGF